MKSNMISYSIEIIAPNKRYSYHVVQWHYFTFQFTDISSSFQSLMSLLNGDEVYVTYTAVEGDKSIVWWFNTIFVTVFVVVFTLITLNILIAIFNSAYETIKVIFIKIYLCLI